MSSPLPDAAVLLSLDAVLRSGLLVPLIGIGLGDADEGRG